MDYSTSEPQILCRWCNTYVIETVDKDGLCNDCAQALEEIHRATKDVRIEYLNPEQY